MLSMIRAGQPGYSPPPLRAGWKERLGVGIELKSGRMIIRCAPCEAGSKKADSCLGSLPDGTILCLYEQGDRDAYEEITLARLTLDRLEKQGSSG